MDEPVEQDGIELVHAVLLMVHAQTGSGILNVPDAFKRTGILFALPLEILFFCLTSCTVTILNVVSAKYKTETLGELSNKIGGSSLGTFTSIIISIFGLLIMMSYLVIIADSWDLVLFTVDEDGFCERHWYYNRSFTVGLSSLFLILPNCFSKNIGSMKYAARIGLFGILYITVLTNVYWVFYDVHGGPVRIIPNNSMEFVLALSTFFYVYHCHVQSVPIFNSLRNNTKKRILLVSVLSSLISCVLQSSVGISGYLSFGDSVFENIIHNFRGDVTPVIIAIVLMSMKISCTIPIILFVTRKEFFRLHKMILNDEMVTEGILTRLSLGFIIFLISISISIYVRTVGIAFGFTGAMTTLYSGFFPGLLLYLTLKSSKVYASYKWHIRFSVVLIAFGILLSSSLFGLTLWRLATVEQSPPRDLCDE